MKFHIEGPRWASGKSPTFERLPDNTVRMVGHKPFDHPWQFETFVKRCYPGWIVFEDGSRTMILSGKPFEERSQDEQKQINQEIEKRIAGDTSIPRENGENEAGN